MGASLELSLSTVFLACFSEKVKNGQTLGFVKAGTKKAVLYLALARRQRPAVKKWRATGGKKTQSKGEEEEATGEARKENEKVSTLRAIATFLESEENWRLCKIVYTVGRAVNVAHREEQKNFHSPDMTHQIHLGYAAGKYNYVLKSLTSNCASASKLKECGFEMRVVQTAGAQSSQTKKEV
eukprot:2393931-Amphidinium_carterae.5